MCRILWAQHLGVGSFDNIDLDSHRTTAQTIGGYDMKTNNKIFRLERTDEVDYDEYDGEIVVASTKREAKELSNVGHYEGLIIKKIGTALKTMKKGIVLSSFNAG